MPLRVQHLLETRFSVRLREAPPAREWLEQRIVLWRRFCLPSIAAQTTQEFTWLLLCDESTDPEILTVLRSCGDEVPMLEVALTSADRGPGDLVRARVRADADVLITTWLDSDDAVADDFVESIRAYAEPFARSTHGTLVVNFPRGYLFDAETGQLYEEHMINGPFASLLERPRGGPVETVLDSSHVMLPHRHLTQQDESRHAWLIAVHGGNLVNRIDSDQRLASTASTDVRGFPAEVFEAPGGLSENASGSS
jgi:Putative rhamnosyl transferase